MSVTTFLSFTSFFINIAKLVFQAQFIQQLMVKVKLKNILSKPSDGLKEYFEKEKIASNNKEAIFIYVEEIIREKMKIYPDITEINKLILDQSNLDEKKLKNNIFGEKPIIPNDLKKFESAINKTMLSISEGLCLISKEFENYNLTINRAVLERTAAIKESIEKLNPKTEKILDLSEERKKNYGLSLQQIEEFKRINNIFIKNKKYDSFLNDIENLLKNKSLILVLIGNAMSGKSVLAKKILWDLTELNEIYLIEEVRDYRAYLINTSDTQALKMHKIGLLWDDPYGQDVFIERTREVKSFIREWARFYNLVGRKLIIFTIRYDEIWTKIGGDFQQYNEDREYEVKYEKLSNYYNENNFRDMLTSHLKYYSELYKYDKKILSLLQPETILQKIIPPLKTKKELNPFEIDSFVYYKLPHLNFEANDVEEQILIKLKESKNMVKNLEEFFIKLNDDEKKYFVIAMLFYMVKLEYIKPILLQYDDLSSSGFLDILDKYKHEVFYDDKTGIFDFTHPKRREGFKDYLFLDNNKCLLEFTVHFILDNFEFLKTEIKWFKQSSEILLKVLCTTTNLSQDKDLIETSIKFLSLIQRDMIIGFDMSKIIINLIDEGKSSGNLETNIRDLVSKFYIERLYAQSIYHSQDFKKSIKPLKNSINCLKKINDPNFSSITIQMFDLLALANFKMNNFKDATKIWQEGDKFIKNNERLLNNDYSLREILAHKGGSYWAIMDWKKARACFKKVLNKYYYKKNIKGYDLTKKMDPENLSKIDINDFEKIITTSSGENIKNITIMADTANYCSMLSMIYSMQEIFNFKIFENWEENCLNYLLKSKTILDIITENNNSKRHSYYDTYFNANILYNLAIGSYGTVKYYYDLSVKDESELNFRGNYKNQRDIFYSMMIMKNNTDQSFKLLERCLLTAEEENFGTNKVYIYILLVKNLIKSGISDNKINYYLNAMKKITDNLDKIGSNSLESFIQNGMKIKFL